MKNILHIIDTTGPGGAETVFIELIKGLNKKCYRSYVLINGPGWVCETLVQAGIIPIVRSGKGSFNIKYLWFIIRFIKSKKVDIIQSHLFGSNTYSALAGLITSTPVVATFHGNVDVGAKERLLSFKFFIINKGANRVVMVSKHLRDYFVSMTNISPKIIEIIYNGIDIKKIQSSSMAKIRGEHNIPQDAVLIGSVGNIRSAKGYDVLLKAAAILKGKTDRFHFVIAGQGKGKLGQEIKALHNSLGLEETVYFLEFRVDIPRILKALDIYLLSSTTEGFSISTIEAMAAGVPVIVTRCGGPEEIVTDCQDGILIDANDPQAIADAIICLSNDQRKRKVLSAAAITSISTRFSTEIMVKSYEQLYQGILA